MQPLQQHQLTFPTCAVSRLAFSNTKMMPPCCAPDVLGMSSSSGASTPRPLISMVCYLVTDLLCASANSAGQPQNQLSLGGDGCRVTCSGSCGEHWHDGCDDDQRNAVKIMLWCVEHAMCEMTCAVQCWKCTGH